MAILVQAIQATDGQRRLDRLESLNIRRSGFENADFKFLLQSMPALTDLQLFRSSSFDLDSWKVLQGTSVMMNLRKLNLQGCREAKGVIIQEAMCTLGNLESLWADMLAATDILEDPKPWICHRLKDLTLAFVIRDRTHQPMILARLSELVLLQSLDLKFPMNWRECHGEGPRKFYPEQCLRLTLEQGLDQLKTLRQLTRLTGPETVLVRWHVEEAQWVLKHWPRLMTVGGFGLSRRRDEVTCLIKSRVEVSK